ncbi:uncharacterized protein LOC144874211 [Branchiostoma floridae x Branchiostoma japonicum]
MTDLDRFTDLDHIFAQWAQEKLRKKFRRPKYKTLVAVDTKDLSVNKYEETYHREGATEDVAYNVSNEEVENNSGTVREHLITATDTTKSSYEWSQTKGFKLSASVSVNVGLPEIGGGLSVKGGAEFQLFKKKTKKRETEDSHGHQTKVDVQPWSKVKVSIETKKKVHKMGFSLKFYLQGKVSVQMKKKSGKTKTVTGDVVDILQKYGTVETDTSGERTVCLSIEGTFEGMTMIDRKVNVNTTALSTKIDKDTGSPEPSTTSTSHLRRKAEDGEEFPGKKKPAACGEEGSPVLVGDVRTYFYYIKEKVSSDWKDLAFHLGFEQPDIDNIEGRNRDDKSRCMDLLEEWLKRNGERATLEVLMEALSEANLQSVVDGLRRKLQEVPFPVPVGAAGIESSSLTAVPAVTLSCAPGIPEIVMPPVSGDCVLGGTAKFICEARGHGQLFYQWYRDGKPVPGGDRSTLHIPQVTLDMLGSYQCCVSNTAGDVMSKPVWLKLPEKDFGPEKPVERYYATDKVALVIGNQYYRNQDNLEASMNDAYTLSNILRNELDFKVVSLTNLDLQDMTNAVQAFCELLNEGVYGVFYYGGKGYENLGQQFMMPIDVPATYRAADCVCAQMVLKKMQEKSTGLNLLLLDMCRMRNKDCSQPPSEAWDIKRPRGNVVFGFATCSNAGAFEVQGERNGIFMSYLKRYITLPLRVTHMLEQVQKGVGQDKEASHVQFPQIMADLREDRTLRDPISFHGHTEEFCIRNQRWAAAHELPEAIDICFQSCGVHVKLGFFAEFSNVMVMYLTVLDLGKTQQCLPSFRDFPPEVEIDVKFSNNDRVEDIGCFSNMVTHFPNPPKGINSVFTRVMDIQKIKGNNLELSLFLDYMIDGETLQESHPILIPKPLVSKMPIWQNPLPPRPLPPHLYPEEGFANPSFQQYPPQWYPPQPYPEYQLGPRIARESEYDFDEKTLDDLNLNT